MLCSSGSFGPGNTDAARRPNRHTDWNGTAFVNSTTGTNHVGTFPAPLTLRTVPDLRIYYVPVLSTCTYGPIVDVQLYIDTMYVCKHIYFTTDCSYHSSAEPVCSTCTSTTALDIVLSSTAVGSA